MAELYKKMYGHLVGEVDGTLQMIGAALVNGECGREKVNEIGEKLKNALLAAEDMYLDAGEEET